MLDSSDPDELETSNFEKRPNWSLSKTDFEIRSSKLTHQAMDQIIHKPPNVPRKMINYPYLSSSILIPLDSENRAAFDAVYTDNVGNGHSVQ